MEVTRIVEVEQVSWASFPNSPSCADHRLRLSVTGKATASHVDGDVA
jgi:hypothetical protein